LNIAFDRVAVRDKRYAFSNHAVVVKRGADVHRDARVEKIHEGFFNMFTARKP
jgi:hypothetical protein